MAHYAGLVLVCGLWPHMGPLGPIGRPCGPPEWEAKIRMKKKKESWFELSDMHLIGQILLTEMVVLDKNIF